MVFKTLVILNEESRIHFNLDAIHESGLQHNLFIRFLYLHTCENSFLKISPKLAQFYSNFKPGLVFLLLQPSNDKDFIAPEEKYFKNIERICNQIRGKIHFLFPFRPAHPSFNREIENSFCRKLSKKSSHFFEIHSSKVNFEGSKEHGLEHFTQAKIIDVMILFLTKYATRPRSIEPPRN